MQNVSFPGLGIYDLPINRVAFELPFGDGFPIYWYGILYAVAFGLCLFLASRAAKQQGLDADLVLDSFLLMIPLGLLGARLYYVAFSWQTFAANPWEVLNFRVGGMAFYGGVLGGILGLYLSARWHKISFMALLDFFAVYLPLGQAIGRWGNFINQEAFGGNTTLPWGMISEQTSAYLQSLGAPFNPEQPVHPTFLYESLGNLVLFVLLLLLRRETKRRGEVLAAYLSAYGSLRLLVEGLRTDALYLPGTDIRVSQLLSLLMLLAGAAYSLYRRKAEPSTDMEARES